MPDTDVPGTATMVASWALADDCYETRFGTAAMNPVPPMKVAYDALTAVLADRDASLDLARAIADRWGEVLVDHALDRTASGPHHLTITLDLEDRDAGR